MMQTDIDFWRSALTALAIIRDSGIITRNQLANALNMSPLAVVDILEELKKHGFITNRNGQARITTAGVKKVRLLALVQQNGDNAFERWCPSNPDGHKRAA